MLKSGKMTRTVSVLLSVVMLFSCFAVFGFAEEDAFTISNPYADIDWDTVGRYKTALHSHTNASDGSISLRQSLERHYETGFDIVAVTDHGTLDMSWREPLGYNLIGKFLTAVGRNEGELDYLGDSGEFANGTTYTVETRGGDDYLVTGDGREILRVPFGTENNAVSVNAHVNSWFAEYKNNAPSDYRTAISGVDAAGGLSVINHPGEYTQARYELYTEDAYDPENLSYKYYINKFYSLITEFDSCLGIDINSKGDGRTRYDRKLWDTLLTQAAKDGETVLALATSDAHQLDKIDTGSVVVLAPEKTSAALKTALQNGIFFPQSTCIGNYDELVAVAEGIKALYGETELYNELAQVIADYEAERDEIAHSSDDGAVGARYDAIDDAGYFDKDARPAIDSLFVDDGENTITINSENALIVRWISDGKQFAVTKADEAVIDLDDYADAVGGYVRAEVFGEGGVVYTQAFMLNQDKVTGSAKRSVDLGFMDFLFALIDRYTKLMSRIITNLFNK